MESKIIYSIRAVPFKIVGGWDFDFEIIGRRVLEKIKYRGEGASDQKRMFEEGHLAKSYCVIQLKRNKGTLRGRGIRKTALMNFV